METSLSRRSVIRAGLAAPVAALVLGSATANAATPANGDMNAAASTLKPAAPAQSMSTKAIQQRLNAKGFWCGSADGVAGPLFSQALTAVQKIHGLPRTGRPDARTVAAINWSIPKPHSNQAGIEVHKDTQTLWVVGHGQPTILDVSTADTGEVFWFHGRRLRASTPNGSFHVYTHVNGWDRGVLGLMYKPYFFNGSVAIHGVPNDELPAYPASHGCCRISVAAQDMLLSRGFLRNGTSVRVSG